jgi:hypothetical protein
MLPSSRRRLPSAPPSRRKLSDLTASHLYYSSLVELCATLRGSLLTRWTTPTIPFADFPNPHGLTVPTPGQQASTLPVLLYAADLHYKSVAVTDRHEQFSLGFFLFLDAAVFSKSALNGSHVHINFVDWIPLICSSLGMLVINSIEKSRLSGDQWSYSGNGVAWKARTVLFLGFALLAGGLAGSACVLALKYVVHDLEVKTMWMGVANVLGNGLIMLSSVVLWVSQNMEDDYTYNLQL